MMSCIDVGFSFSRVPIASTYIIWMGRWVGHIALKKTNDQFAFRARLRTSTLRRTRLQQPLERMAGKTRAAAIAAIVTAATETAATETATAEAAAAEAAAAGAAAGAARRGAVAGAAPRRTRRCAGAAPDRGPE